MGIRVMVVGKQAKARLSVRIFLRSCKDMEFVGEAKSIAETVSLCTKVLPDVVMVSMTMADMSLIPLIQVLHNQYPDIRIVILNHVNDEFLEAQALNAGAEYIVPRNSSRDYLLNAIKYTAMVGHSGSMFC